MCEITCEKKSNSLLLIEKDSEWIACGRKLHGSNTSLSSANNDVEKRKNDGELYADLNLELCDPMRRKITFMKPSLTPGAGTRIIKRRKPSRQDLTEESISETEEAFRQWREAMRAMARLPEGIPSQFRRRIWLILATHQLNSQYIDWPRLSQTLFMPRSAQASEAEEGLVRQIEKDLHRTGSGACITAEADRTALQNVLTAYARWNRRVGYCQGFNILASVILNVMDLDEEAALKVMIFLIDYVLPESYFARSLQALSVDVAVFRDLVALCQPLLSSHLQKLQQHAAIETLNFTSFVSNRPLIEPPLTDLFAIQWFLTLFSTCLPMDTVLRIWDAVLLEGSEVGLRAGLVVMGILSDDLMKLPSADKFYSSMNQWMEEIVEGSSRPELETVNFIRRVYDIAPLPWPRLGDLRKRYAAISEDGKEETPSTASYGDGYDEEAKKTKSKWWHIRLNQVVDKSPSEARNQPMTVRQGCERTDSSPETSSPDAHRSQASPCTLEPSSSLPRRTEEAPTSEPSDINSTDKMLVSHHDEQQQQECAPSLTIDDDRRTEVLQRTPYHLDDSFLQTISEWQRRNAAAPAIEDYDNTDLDALNSPSGTSVRAFSVSKTQRTLLSIVEQKRMADPSSSNTNEANSPPTSLTRSAILAKKILHDRAVPQDTSAINSAAAKPELGVGIPQSSKPPSPLSPCEVVERPSKQVVEASDPPWAAAMAAIGAIPRLLDRHGRF